jgi:Flp pilus assembly protein TadG
MNRIDLHRRREDGSILGMAAISMAAILLAVGLAIDVGHWYLVGGELQNAADAGALAAASALDSTAGGITRAVDRAVATVNQYEFSGTNATVDRADVKFATTLAAFDDGTALSEGAASGVAATIKFVQVAIPNKSVSVFFASLATNSSTISLSRSAVAGQSVELNTVCNVAPFSVVEYNTGDTTTQYLNSPDCPSTKQFTRGCTYVIQLEPGNGVSAGNYQLLSFEGERGGSALREKIAIGTDGCVSTNAEIPVYTEPGQKSGPVRDGINTRFDDYGANLSYTDYPPDANIREGITYEQYRDPNYFTPPSSAHLPGVWDRRVMVVPIIQASEFDSGRNVVTIHKFGAFFLRDKVPNGNSGALTAEYIGEDVVFGNGGYTGTGTGFPGLSVAVLYR